MRTQTAATSAVVRNFPHDRRSDADLVRDVAHGEDGALAAVWRRHAGRVRRTLLAQLGDDSAVDDLLQEIFFAFSQNAQRITQPEKLLSYLMAAAVRQARQVMRNRMRQRRWLGRWADEHRGDTARPTVDGRDAVRTLRRILERLPERLRETFVLRFVEELSVPEVADLRGVSLATAKRDIGRSQQKVLKHAEREPALLEYLRAGERCVGEPTVPAQIVPAMNPQDASSTGAELADRHAADRPSEVQPGEVQPGEVQPGEVQPGEVQPGEVQPGEVQPGGPRHSRVDETPPPGARPPAPPPFVPGWGHRSRQPEARSLSGTQPVRQDNQPIRQGTQQDHPAAQPHGQKERS